MHELLGLNAEQIITVGTGLGAFIAAFYAAFRGNRREVKEPVTLVPKAAIPHELQDEIDRIDDAVRHIEKKVDNLRSQATLIYTDTQVIRALQQKP